ncbi:stage II sporulation protein D [Halalkalibacter akibai]|uniref:Stage II sporulation protein D n=1 Tax=Halalkalibacter akibai (strain ATCC 43226 / DSM 21942 / CIP 109018 / JCM 9157 / 1139) TaxID=1236973 RepID=W4QXL5_HALA3|nr:stage II sporulation protein D [Halalkalibacter akibai]GAE36836.1 stage II sporulation protein D [Halalkalibacter akibai JCM 9157]
MRRLFAAGFILCTVILVIPTMLVLFSTFEQEVSISQNQSEITVPSIDYDPSEDIAVAVFRTSLDSVETVPLEEYVMGVVSSEMPVAFELEALKAQAVAARTFILKLMLSPNTTKVPQGAIATDTVTHQVYRNMPELRELWGNDYEGRISKVMEAVLSTKGEILTYDGEPITASFFSTSNGYTENSEDYWKEEISYLRSVESPWDGVSPRFNGKKEVSIEEFEKKLSVSLPSDGTVGTIVERTKGGRVAKVNINGVELSGRDIRELLDLDSSDFSWQRIGGTVVFETRGLGHGIGMSQYGAEGMAKEGSTYEDILNHYYHGTTIDTFDKFEGRVTALLTN